MIGQNATLPVTGQVGAISAEIAILRKTEWVPSDRVYQPVAGAVPLDVAEIQAIVVPTGPNGPWTKYNVSVIGEGGVIDDGANAQGFTVSVRKHVDVNAKRHTILREMAVNDATYKNGSETKKGTLKYFLYEA